MVPASRLREIDARRICVIKPSAFGDIVQALPLLPMLRDRFPNAHIAWVANRTLTDLLAGHPALDEIIAFDRNGTWQNSLQLLHDLRRKAFDLVFDLQGLLRTGLMVAATRASLRVGLETAREGANFACNCTIPDSGRMVPAHLRYWRVAEALGMEDCQRLTLVRISEEDRRWADRQLAVLKRPPEPRAPVLAIHPGARWTTKRWPVEKFSVIGAKAIRTYGFSIVLLGSPDEQPVAAQLESLLKRFVPAGNVLNLTGKTTLKQLAAVLQAADVCLTNDSGPMHLAAGLETSVVGIFTCTSAIGSGPPGKNHELVSTELPCAASYRKKCPYQGSQHMACMEELAAERVWSAFVRLVERKRRQPKAA
jgi:lipopolysaccharide heptosyltransferase II